MVPISSADVTLAQLRALVTVAEVGSFTAAAARLGLTQSGVSQAIAGLETALGGVLLARERSGTVPTALGVRVLAEAREVVARLEAIRQHAAHAAGLEMGTLRLASVPSAAARVLPPLLRRFRQRHPGLDLVLLEGTDAEVADWVGRRLVDAGLLGDVGPSLQGLHVTPIAADELLFVVRRSHPVARQGRVRLADVGGEPLLLSTGGCEPLVRAAYAAAGLEPRVAMAVRELPTLLALVREGLGVTLVPELALPPGAPAGLRGVGLEPGVRRRLVLATASPAPSPVLRAFLTAAGLGLPSGRSQIISERRVGAGGGTRVVHRRA